MHQSKFYNCAKIWYNKRVFTGIAEETGKILTIRENDIEIECKKVLEGTQIGDSIAVNGVCLTVVQKSENSFKADMSPETFRVTAFKGLKSGTAVNLERAMPANGRFGGHIVSGHIDGTAKVISLNRNRESFDLEIELSDEQIRYVIRKGSICVNGISLTVAEISGKRIKIAVIPHTYECTALSELKTGENVNIEVDIMAKYIEKFLSMSDNRSGINMDFLQRNGFC